MAESALDIIEIAPERRRRALSLRLKSLLLWWFADKPETTEDHHRRAKAKARAAEEAWRHGYPWPY